MSNFTPEQIQEILDIFFDNFAHRQYIGARYVPIFGRKDEESIEWDNTGTYEPLTIVLNEGNSYTSRQFVPVGVDIDNEEYWAQTGNYNAQVEQYRREVADLAAMLPDSEFDSEHTVKDYIDANWAIIPAADFDSVNTVKKYVDDGLSAINDIIPASSFDSVNTVKSYIDNFFEDVTDDSPAKITVNKDDNSGSVYILAKIERENITPFFAFNTTEYPDGNIYEYVKSKAKSILCTSCLHGPTVRNGLVLTGGPTSDDYYFAFFGFDENNDPKYTLDTTRQLDANDLITDGYNIAFPIWFPVIINDTKVNITSIDDGTTRFSTLAYNKHTRTLFGYDDDYFYILIIEGRMVFSEGATIDEAADLGLALDIPNLFNFDGGGSTQLWTSGDATFNAVFPGSENLNSFMNARNVIGLLGMEM